MLLKNTHLLRFPRPSSLRRTSKYASFLRISGALHLGVFEQPQKINFFNNLIVLHHSQPFPADMKTLAAAGLAGLVELVMATHAGMTTEEFERIVKDCLATARHPKFNRPYTDLVFQPMLEFLAYLRANDFRTFIVSGGGAARADKKALEALWMNTRNIRLSCPCY